MKKQFLTTCAITAISILAANDSYGQWIPSSGGVNPNDIETDNSNVDNVYINNMLSVGIPSSTPLTEALTVGGDVSISGDIRCSSNINASGNINSGGDVTFIPSFNTRRILANTNMTGSIQLLANTSLTDGAGIELYPDGHSTKPGTIEYTSYNMSAGSSDPAHDFIFNDGTTSASLLTIYKNSNISIGTTYKTAKLNVGGSLWLDGPIAFDAHPTYRGVFANSDEGLLLYGKTNAADGGFIIINSNSNLSDPGEVSFVSGGTSTSSSDIAFTFMQYGTGAGQYGPHMMIYKNGKVAIGDAWPHTNTTGAYRLYVHEGIITEKLKVANIGTNAWSDYVFEDNYDLKSLEHVENYIKTNKHLPDVPSAKQVSKDGIDVAEMDATLLRKIEELTLYVIQQQKEIEELKSKLNK